MISVQQISGRYRFVSAAEAVVLGRELDPSTIVLRVDTEVPYWLIYDDGASGEPDYVTVTGDALESFTLAPVLDAWSVRWVVDESAERALAAAETAEGVTSHTTVYGEAGEAFELGHTLSVTSGDQHQEEAQASARRVIDEVAAGRGQDVDGTTPEARGAAGEPAALARTADGESVLATEDSAIVMALDITNGTATGETAVVSMSATADEALTLGADLSVTSSDQEQEEALVSVSLGMNEVATGEAEHLSASVSESVGLGAEVSHDYQPRPEESRAAEAALGVSESAAGEYVVPPAQSSTATETVALERAVSTTATDQDTEDTQVTAALTIVETAIGTAEHLAAAVSEAVTIGRAAEGAHTPKPEVSRSAETAIGRSEAASGQYVIPPAAIGAASESVTLGREESATAIDQDQEDTQASRTPSITETAVGVAEHLTASVSEAVTLGRSSTGTGAEPVTVSRTATRAISISESAAGAFSLPPAITAAASEGVALGRDQSTTVQDQDQEHTQVSRTLGRTETATGTAEHLNAATSESRTLGKTAAGSVVVIPDMSRTATRVLTRFEWGFGSASEATPVSRAVVESRTLGKSAAGSQQVTNDYILQWAFNDVDANTFNGLKNKTVEVILRSVFGQVWSSRTVYMDEIFPGMLQNTTAINWGTSDGWHNARLRVQSGLYEITTLNYPANTIANGQNVITPIGGISIHIAPL